MTKAKKTNYLPMLIICLWFIAMAFSFWWFEYRYWQFFADAKVTFDGQVLEELLNKVNENEKDMANRKVTVVHFTDGNCPCSSYSRAHIKNLQGVLAQSRQITANPSDGFMKDVAIPATPSVAVWDESGKLAYFGPYSGGTLCGQGEDFVSRIMGELQQQRNPQWINMLGIGCYCPWNKAESLDG
jgi:hypothetical protein